MPDISMCKNETCPSHKNCYRFMATPNPQRQSYMDFQVANGSNGCDSFVPHLYDYREKDGEK